MNTVPNASDDSRLKRAGAAVQAYARIAGALSLLSLIAGGFGEAWVPSRLIVSADAVATAENIKAFDLLFRLGFAGYLVEAVCDIALTLILYVLLRPVHKDLALLAAFFGLIGTALFGVAEFFYFGTSQCTAAPGRVRGLTARFTKLQGQYLAFMHAYTKIHRVAPAEADMQRYFRVTPPSVHQMILTLEKDGLISRIPGRARSMELLVPRDELPALE